MNSNSYLLEYLLINKNKKYLNKSIEVSEIFDKILGKHSN